MINFYFIVKLDVIFFFKKWYSYMYEGSRLKISFLNVWWIKIIKIYVNYGVVFVSFFEVSIYIK